MSNLFIFYIAKFSTYLTTNFQSIWDKLGHLQDYFRLLQFVEIDRNCAVPGNVKYISFIWKEGKVWINLFMHSIENWIERFVTRNQHFSSFFDDRPSSPD